ncbi:MAG: T9SS type A sorting domain-containing protein [Bacteroidia bacterium]
MRVKSLFFTLLFFISVINLLDAQTPSWQWAHSEETPFSFSVTSDLSGNAIIAGTCGFDTLAIGSDTLFPFGMIDIYTAKYDAAGNILWARCAGGIYDEEVTSVTTDASGNIIVCGWFGSDSMTFGSTVIYNHGPFFSPYLDFFIVKYDGNGNVLWAKCGGGSDNDLLNSVTTDGFDNIIATGSFRSPLIALGTDTLSNNFGANDLIFTVKYDSNGNVIWAKSIQGGSSCWGSSIAADNSGSIILTGQFNGFSMVFDSITVYNMAFSTKELFLAKYDSDGNFVWVNFFGGNGYDHANSVAVHSNGDIVVTGFYEGPSITFDSITLNNNGYFNMFLVKYDSLGNELWAKSAGGAYSVIAWSVAADAAGNSYVAGNYNDSSITFGSFNLNNVSPPYQDIFAAKYDVNGNVSWALGAGGVDHDNAYSIATDAFGDVFITGKFFYPSISFGTINLNNNIVSCFNTYVAKIDEATGLSENFINNTFNVYPNPANSTINFVINKNENIVVRNLYGEILLKKDYLTHEDQKLALDISLLVPGIYIINAGNKTQKFVKL